LIKPESPPAMATNQYH